MSYESFSPDMFGKGCYDTIKYVGEALHNSVPEGIPAYVVGGIAVAPLREGVDTEICAESKEIKVQPNSDLPLFRMPTKPGSIASRRDLDIVVGGCLTDRELGNIHREVGRAVEGKMPVSVFGFDAAKERLSPKERRRLNIGSFVSRRMLPEGARSITEVDDSILQLYPFQVAVPKGVYDVWDMYLPDGDAVPVMPPITTHLNYFVRSIGGSRPKDQEKLEKMRRELFGYHVANMPQSLQGTDPEVGEEPLGCRQWNSVARNAHRLVFREELQTPTYELLGALARTLDRVQRETFLTKKYIRPDVLHPQATAADFIAAKARAAIVRSGERHEAIVSRVQTDAMQNFLRRIVGQSR